MWPKPDPNTNRNFNPTVRVEANSWGNDKGWKAETKCKTWISS